MRLKLRRADVSEPADSQPDQDGGLSDQAPPRAEAIIADIYAQTRAARDAGLQVSRVVMSAEHYRLLQEYRSRLGDLADPAMEYLDRYSVFSLDIEIDDVASARVG
ncbi:MAG: hypothetical protein EA382_10175 [Spirochaetaceae bacterium]|nr:MAG: hypothetical protein EA382_10175 [Spirochaetaceae bacterium]